MNEQQTQQPQSPPPNYLVFAILTTIFCCQILGIISIVFAAQVNSKWNSGDYQGALNASKNAKLWAWVAFGSGVLIILAVTLLSIFGVLAGLSLGGMDF
ncbi:MAG: CD225/dispanin family protein [Draconibacterium sp.]